MGLPTRFTRRRMLQTLGLGTAGFLFKDLLFADGRARADAGSPPKIIIFCYFSGGWDQLMALDPRPCAFGSTGAQLFPQAGSSIDPGYDQIADTTADVSSDGLTTKVIYNWLKTHGADTHGLLSLGTTGINVGPAFYDTVWTNPAINTDLNDLCSRPCIIRGINMGTLTHEVGRRYFITGKFPRGLQAAGSALPTWVTSLNGDGPTSGAIPNLSVGVETYNENLPAFASGLLVNTANDIVNVLKPLNPESTNVTEARDAALDAYFANQDCWQTQLDGTGLVTTLQNSRVRARDMLANDLYGRFSFPQNTTDATLQNLYGIFGLSGLTSSQFYNAVNGAKGQALIAARAVTPDANTSDHLPVSTCVSIQLATGIDDHDVDWANNHGASLRAGFDALGRLIRYLSITPDPLNNGQPLIERTQLMAFSEFARTPNINSRGGRDHHLASSCLLAGGGIRGGLALGGTADADFGPLPMDLTTGATVPTGSGYTVRPSDIHATFLQAAGLGYANLSNQTPVLIPAALKSPP